MTLASGPRGFPVLGSLLEWRKNPALFALSLKTQYGDLVPYRLGPFKTFLVSNPEWIRDILVTRQHDFVKGAGLAWAREFLGEGLLTAEAPFHTRQRRLAQPAFHRQRIGSYAEAMVRRASAFADRIQDGARLDLSKDMMALTLGIAGETLFSAEVEGEAGEIGPALHLLMEEFLNFASPLAQIRRRLFRGESKLDNAKKRIDTVIFRIIEERRREPGDRGDLLSMLMAARDEEDGSAMSDEQLRDECVTIFLAGHETTANALAWAFAALGQHSRARETLDRELASALQGRTPMAADFGRLPYAESVIAETMRLFPPAWAMARRNKTQLEIDGVTIPAMSSLVMSPYVVHRDARFYGDPLAFRPERWTTEFKASLPPFAYFPFGGGARKCIGEGFAWMEAVLILATLAQRFHFDLAPDARIEPEALITLRPRFGVPVIAKKAGGAV